MIDIELWKSQASDSVSAYRGRWAGRASPHKRQVIENIASKIDAVENVAVFTARSVRAKEGKGSESTVWEVLGALQYHALLVRDQTLGRNGNRYLVFHSEEGMRRTFSCMLCGGDRLPLDQLGPFDPITYAVALSRGDGGCGYYPSCVKHGGEVAPDACPGCHRPIEAGEECWVNQRSVCVWCYIEIVPPKLIARLVRGESVVLEFSPILRAFDEAVLRS